MPESDAVASRSPRSWFNGRTYVFAGRLTSWSLEEATRLIESAGGRVASRVSRQVDAVVIGESNRASEKLATEKVERARSLVEEGHAIELVDESELRKRLGHDEIQQSGYTIRQLSRITGLSEPRLRAWVQRGVLRPTRQLGRVALFEFEDASTLRKLGEIIGQGRDPKHVLAEIRRAEGWWNEDKASGDRVLSRLVERDGELLVKLDDDLLSETGGQLRLPLEGESASARIETLFGKFAPESRSPNSDDPGRWFEYGVECEAREAWTDAADAYKKSLELGSRAPEVAFNLGNVEAVRGDIASALDAYLRAIDIDPEFVEAWNNIGNVFAEHGRSDDALAAYERALELSPDYPDAHFNLAELHLKRDDKESAWRHAFRYFRHDSQSDWAQRLLRRFR